MIGLTIGDIVLCSRLGTGQFKVKNLRGSGKGEHALLEPVNDGKEEWVYTALCGIDTKTFIANRKKIRDSTVRSRIGMMEMWSSRALEKKNKKKRR